MEYKPTNYTGSAICPKCLRTIATLENGVLKCEKCGYVLTAKPIDQPQVTMYKTARKCDQCDDFLDSDGTVLYCYPCGYKIDNVSCPVCGRLNEHKSNCWYRCYHCSYDAMKDIPPSEIAEKDKREPGNVPTSQDDKLEQDFRNLLDEAFELWKRKNQSYGNFNISVMGLKGVFVRMFDKCMRLHRMIWLGKENNLGNENLEDTLIDTCVYSLIAVLILRDKWPSNPMGDDTAL